MKNLHSLFKEPNFCTALTCLFYTRRDCIKSKYNLLVCASFGSGCFALHTCNSRMSSLLKIVPKKPYVDLVVSFKGGIDTDGCAEDESGPEVRYYHGITEN